MMRRLQRQDTGATAVEYALIAGLIGLGLVGSLVTTKGSLNALFGTASSQMGSAQSGGAAPTYGSLAGNSALARAGFWQSKTLAAPPKMTVSGSTTTWSYAFTDGYTAQFSRGEGGNYDTRLYVYDPNTNTRFQVATNSSGQITGDALNIYNTYGQVTTETYSDVAYSDTWSGTTPNRQRSRSFTYADTSPTSNPSGSSGTFTVTAATADFVQRSTTGYQDFQYFKDLNK